MPSALSDTISTHLAVAGSLLPVQTRAVYDTSDPYAVRFDFMLDGCPPIRWHFERDMLAEGVRRPVGEGDVSLRPRWTGGRETLVMELWGDTRVGFESAVLITDSAQVSDFLEESYRLVARGAESWDVDGFLYRIRCAD
ncbi:SsgA family sporulation/cell division regulator [Streptomyces avidinii]|uniref:SsgA family sporulation/cell division regulator n=1 Tax=Streptomyces avidinii TaxID=1895 RepID=UPI0037A58FB7|nr:SsgA family sporulation/cell division regulator [Streptomyces avidinii]